jgi:preprotein translocase subunit SecG
MILIDILLAIWMIVALLMIFVILMQRPKSEGLGAAFGGAVTENIFGAQTTNVLVKFTGWLAGIFFVVTFTLSILYAHKATGDSALRRELLKTQSGTTAPLSSPGQPAGATSVPPGAAAAGLGMSPAGSAAPLTSPPPAAAAVGVVPPASAPIAPSAAPAASATAKPSRKPH